MLASNREAPESSATQNQIYWMRPDGGEARRITDAAEGVSNFAFSRSRVLTWAFTGMERFVVRRSKVVVVICQHLQDLVREIEHELRRDLVDADEPDRQAEPQ